MPSLASADYAFVDKWGSGGSADGQFRAPYGLATDSACNVYVTDFGNGLGQNDRVEKFSSNGEFLAKWGNLGSGDTQFHDPWGIAVDSGDRVYVADTANRYIKKFSPAGVFDLKFGGGGPGDGEFSMAIGVAVDSAGSVYVTDHDTSPAVDRIQKFVPALGGYAYNDQWGENGSASGKFNEPSDVAVDSAGNVYVSDRKNHRVQKFDSEGFFLTEWGGNGSTDGKFAFPEGIATDAENNVYVADRGNNRIEKFSSAGAFIAKWGSTGSGDGQFAQPNDVTVDSAGNVYVADTGNDRIQKFAEAGSTGGCGGATDGAAGGGAPSPVSNEFTIESTSSSTKDGKIKFKLKLPAPGIAVAVAHVTPPPRPPSLDPSQRKLETGRNRLFARGKAKKKRKTITAARARATAAAPGIVTLVLAPNRKTREVLAWKGALKTKVAITYTPTGGSPNTVVKIAKFKRVARRATHRASH